MEDIINVKFNGVKVVKKNGKYSAFVSTEIGTDNGKHIECDTMMEIADEIKKANLELVHSASEDILLYVMHKYNPQPNAVLDLLGGLQEGENTKLVRKFLEDVLIEKFGVQQLINLIKYTKKQFPFM